MNSSVHGNVVNLRKDASYSSSLQTLKINDETKFS